MRYRSRVERLKTLFERVIGPVQRISPLRTDNQLGSNAGLPSRARRLLLRSRGPFARPFRRLCIMATYVILSTFTEKGIGSVKQTTKRADAARAAAKEVGVNLREVLWTQGQYDVVSIVEAPDEAAVAAFGLSLAGAGNVRSQTLRAFTKDEMEKILAKVA
jgi:uncharacterized protein with GYD domain